MENIEMKNKPIVLDYKYPHRQTTSSQSKRPVTKS